ncbi:MAG: lipase maturation factor family protein, partial [Pseudomonadota bacterium]
LECLFLCALLALRPGLGVWVGRLLLFRFMLLSGAVKLLSGDAIWANGTALEYHFETQPLPTLFAWYAHQLPDWFLYGGVMATFIIELALPFLIFLPRNPRLVAIGSFVFLELLILLTGSYNFFNLLTIVLCIALLNDQMLPSKRWKVAGINAVKSIWLRIPTAIIGILLIIGGVLHMASTLSNRNLPNWAATPLIVTSSFHFVNGYGLFAVMTTQRDEIIIEGSMDRENWLPYKFPFQPGELDRMPVLATPHQPRLDWQMWFAALGPVERNQWFYAFAQSLLEAKPAVLELVEAPFESEPPRYIRAVRYRYRFSTPEQRRETGQWWTRTLIEGYMPIIQLRREFDIRSR